MFPFSFWSIGAPAFVSPYSAPLWSLRAVTFSWGLCLRFVCWRFLCLFSGLSQPTAKLQGKHEFSWCVCSSGFYAVPESVCGCSPQLQPVLSLTGPKTVLAYLRAQLRRAEKCKLMKMIIVGPPRQGKSTLVEILQTGKVPQMMHSDATIRTTKWELPKPVGHKAKVKSGRKSSAPVGCWSLAGSIWAEIVLLPRAVSITSQVMWF